MNLAKFKCTPDDIRAAVVALWRGDTWKSVMARYGVTQGAIEKRSKQMGLPLPRGTRRTRKPLRITMPSDPSELGYLAAMLDGEGHICIRLEATPRAYAFLGITNTSQVLMDYLSTIGGSIQLKVSSKVPSRTPAYTWALQGRLDCLAFLTAVEPYMLIKRAKAQQAIVILREWESDRQPTPAVVTALSTT